MTDKISAYKFATLALFLELRHLNEEMFEFKLNVICAMAFDEGRT